jgi:hypothetical protein
MRWFGTIFGVRGDWRVARYECVGSGEENEMGDAERDAGEEKSVPVMKTETNYSPESM